MNAEQRKYYYLFLILHKTHRKYKRAPENKIKRNRELDKKFSSMNLSNHDFIFNNVPLKA